MNAKATFLAACFLCALFAPVAASAETAGLGGTSVADGVSAANGSSAADGASALPVPERWVAPPPTESPLLDILEGDDPVRSEKVRGISMSIGIAGLCAGTMIAASGFYGLYSAARFGPDIGAMNAGIGAVVSGSLVTAVSSMIFSASRERSATARE